MNGSGSRADNSVPRDDVVRLDGHARPEPIAWIGLRVIGLGCCGPRGCVMAMESDLLVSLRVRGFRGAERRERGCRCDRHPGNELFHFAISMSRLVTVYVVSGRGAV